MWSLFINNIAQLWNIFKMWFKKQSKLQWHLIHHNFPKQSSSYQWGGNLPATEFLHFLERICFPCLFPHLYAVRPDICPCCCLLNFRVLQAVTGKFHSRWCPFAHSSCYMIWNYFIPVISLLKQKTWVWRLFLKHGCFFFPSWVTQNQHMFCHWWHNSRFGHHWLAISIVLHSHVE